MRRACESFVALLAITSCEASGTGASDGAIRDSAGIRVVTNGADREEAAAVWQISGAPVWDLGTVNIGSELPFYDVVGVLRLRDGSLVVANAGTHELRVYDPTGEYRASVGRQGSGPGEFEQIHSIWKFAGDSIAVWDLRQRRLTIFNSQGDLVRIAHPRPAPSGDFPPLYGVLDDGTFVLGRGLSLASVFQAGTGAWRDTVQVLHYSNDGEFLNTLGTFSGSEKYAKVGSSGFSIVPVPFGRQTHVNTGGSRVYVGTGDAYEIIGLSTRGDADIILRKQHLEVPVSQRAVSAYKEARLASLDRDKRAEEERRLAELPFAQAMPPYSALIVDELGNVWVRESTAESGDESSSWSVFGPDGILVATTRVPAGVAIHSAGLDWIAGVYRDDMDVEHVRLYQIEK